MKSGDLNQCVEFNLSGDRGKGTDARLHESTKGVMWFLNGLQSRIFCFMAED